MFHTRPKEILTRFGEENTNKVLKKLKIHILIKLNQLRRE